jgi:hypothetical protein
MTPDEFIQYIILNVSDLMTQIIDAAGQATHIYAARFDRHAQHTSHLSGEEWVQELLQGHDNRIYNELGMNKTVFLNLLKVLRIDAGVCGSHYVTAGEQLATFLYYALKHSLPAIRGKRKRTERLGSLTKRYRSAGRALTKRNNTPSRTGLGKLNLSRKPRRFPILSGPTRPLKRY